MAEMLLITHNGRRGHSGGTPGLRVGEPQVQQRGVIAQVTADVVEQVVAQQLGQPPGRLRGSPAAGLAPTRDHGRALRAAARSASGYGRPRPS